MIDGAHTFPDTFLNCVMRFAAALLPLKAPSTDPFCDPRDCRHAQGDQGLLAQYFAASARSATTVRFLVILRSIFGRRAGAAVGATMVLGGENTFGIASLSNRDSFFADQPVLSQVRLSPRICRTAAYADAHSV